MSKINSAIFNMAIERILADREKSDVIAIKTRQMTTRVDPRVVTIAKNEYSKNIHEYIERMRGNRG